MPSSLQAEVALFSPPYTTLTYTLPEYLPQPVWAAGLRVAAPLGNGVRSGIILSLREGSDAAGNFILKPLLWPLEKKALLGDWYLELARQMALRHTVTPGNILANILPASLRTTQVRLRFWDGGTPEEMKLPELRKKSNGELARLGALWREGQADFCGSGNSSKDSELCMLLHDAPWPVRPSAKAQIAVLEYLLEHGAVSRKQLTRDLGKNSAAPLSLLVQRGLVSVRPAGETHTVSEPEKKPQKSKGLVNARSFTLTEAQQQVFTELLAALCSRQAATHLLFGITGSGKTAVYLELARESLAMGRSVLLLAPEVALALKLYNDVLAAFPAAPSCLFHGYLPVSLKEKTFRALARKTEPVICVGTRSALFLPLENVGLIVLDEEHDSSFKQDEGFTYQAKEIAWYRAGRENALLLLGSATPDVKSYHAAMEKKIPLHRLDDRVGGGELPEVEIVALPKSQADKSLLAVPTVEALRRTVEAGEQAVIMLNRRGYAPLMYCLGCGSVVKCPHCDIGLAYHKGRERLVCHYCGYGVPFPSPCAACKSLNFLPMGEGTEKIEETLPALLPPGTKILRLDRDSTRRPGRMEEILSAFGRKEASVLVGTQMLSKGHHFPDVTLAIVADADLGLNLPDYRAAERTFQLLVQSSGRAGRGDKKGRVIIQTRDPSHYCWAFVKTADYAGFFEREIALRQKRGYPPFIHLALLRISHPMQGETAQDEVAALGALLRAKGQELGVTVLGPAPAPLPFLKGRKRFHCLVKSGDWQKLRSLFSMAREACKKGSLRVTLDLDPVNML